MSIKLTAAQVDNAKSDFYDDSTEATYHWPSREVMWKSSEMSEHWFSAKDKCDADDGSVNPDWSTLCAFIPADQNKETAT